MPAVGERFPDRRRAKRLVAIRRYRRASGIGQRHHIPMPVVAVVVARRTRQVAAHLHAARHTIDVVGERRQQRPAAIALRDELPALVGIVDHRRGRAAGDRLAQPVAIGVVSELHLAPIRLVDLT